MVECILLHLIFHFLGRIELYSNSKCTPPLHQRHRPICNPSNINSHKTEEPHPSMENSCHPRPSSQIPHQPCTLHPYSPPSNHGDTTQVQGGHPPVAPTPSRTSKILTLSCDHLPAAVRGEAVVDRPEEANKRHPISTPLPRPDRLYKRLITIRAQRGRICSSSTSRTILPI